MATNPFVPSKSDLNQNLSLVPFSYFEVINELEIFFNTNHNDKIFADKLDNMLRFLETDILLEDLHYIMDDIKINCNNFFSLLPLCVFAKF